MARRYITPNHLCGDRYQWVDKTINHCSRASQGSERGADETALITNIYIPEAESFASVANLWLRNKTPFPAIVLILEIDSRDCDRDLTPCWSLTRVYAKQEWGLVGEHDTRCEREHTLHTDFDIYGACFMRWCHTEDLPFLVVVPATKRLGNSGEATGGGDLASTSYASKRQA